MGGWVGGWVRNTGNKAQLRPAGAGALPELGKIENLELKLNTLEEKVEQDYKDLSQKLNSLSDSLDQISERIKEVEQNNYILMHAVDDVEKASKVIQIQLEAMSEPDLVCHFCDQVFQSELHLQNNIRMEHGRAHRDKT